MEDEGLKVVEVPLGFSPAGNPDYQIVDKIEEGPAAGTQIQVVTEKD